MFETRPTRLRVSQVSEGVMQMEQALVLLKEGGSPPLAPGLSKDIQDGLIR